MKPPSPTAGALSALLLIILTTTAHPADPLPTIPAPDFTNLPTAAVQKIVDGDTIILRYNDRPIKCRLIGVDTPETKHPSKPVQPYGHAATTFTTNLLLGEKVWVSADTPGAHDLYQRLLVYIWRQPDGLFINAEIIRQGYGHAYTTYPFKYLSQFSAYEKHARQARKGLWATHTDPAAPQTKKPAFEWRAPSNPVRLKRSASPSRNSPRPGANPSAATVYHTPNGEKYHYPRCASIARSKTIVPTTPARARARKLQACKICRPPL